jgi:hypothetical protein
MSTYSRREKTMADHHRSAMKELVQQQQAEVLLDDPDFLKRDHSAGSPATP